MTKSAVGLASDLCRTYVGPLAVVILAAFAVGSPAQAGAWEEFERRCLVPMENVQEPIVSDLEFLKEKTVRGGGLVRLFFSKDFVMSQMLDDRESSVGCTIGVVPGASDEQVYLFSNAFDSWKRAKLRTGEYASPKFGVEIGGINYGVVLFSNLTREPVLQVGLSGLDEDELLTVVVLETALES